MHAKFLKSSTLIVLLCSAGWVQALTSDKSAPLQVEAQTFESDSQSAVSIFRGEVVITKGSILLKADEARLKVIDGEVVEATIIGSPVEFQQQPDQGDLIKGHAKRIEYSAENNLVELTGDAKVTQGSDVFASETIRYDTLKESVIAQSDKTATERVRMTFTPKQEEVRLNDTNSGGTATPPAQQDESDDHTDVEETS